MLIIQRLLSWLGRQCQCLAAKIHFKRMQKVYPMIYQGQRWKLSKNLEFELESEQDET